MTSAVTPAIPNPNDPEVAWAMPLHLNFAAAFATDSAADSAAVNCRWKLPLFLTPDTDAVSCGISCNSG